MTEDGKDIKKNIDVLGKLICLDCGSNTDLLDCMVTRGEQTINTPICYDCLNKFKNIKDKDDSL